MQKAAMLSSKSTCLTGFVITSTATSLVAGLKGAGMNNSQVPYIFAGWCNEPFDNGKGELMVTLPKSVADDMLAYCTMLENDVIEMGEALAELNRKWEDRYE